MDVLEAIRTRVMRPKVRPDAPSRPEIEELLEAAVRAPTHHLTEPWRFYVLAGDSRQLLAKAIAEASVDAGTDADAARADAEKKVGRAPVIVVFTCIPSTEEGVVRDEELASVAMAIQNFLLAAHAKGLGAMLRTGPAAYHPSIRAQLSLAPDESVVGFVYLGYPDGQRALTPRATAAERTTWL
jgi:nitroreductase